MASEKNISFTRQQQFKFRNVVADYKWAAGGNTQLVEPDVPIIQASVTPSFTATPTPTPSTSITTPIISTTPSVTPTPTPSTSITTPIISTTPSVTVTPSVTRTPSTTPSVTVTPSVTRTPSITPSASITPSITTTPTPSNTFNVTANGLSAYIINSQSNPTLSITEGETYTFNINASGHPFWIKTVNSTGTGNAYNDGVTNNGTANGTITFVVPYDAPSTLYYNCQYHSSMAGIINVTDVPTPTATPSPTPTPSPT